MIGQIRPDIALIDADLLDCDCITILEMTQELYPEVKVIVLIPSENITSILDNALYVGAKGFLPKTINPKELLKSIIDAEKLGATIHPTLIPQIFKKLSERPQNISLPKQSLSDREWEVMNLVAQGKSNREIAEDLFISENTVKGHIRRISNKLNIDNRVDIARYVLLNKQLKYKDSSKYKDLCVK